MILNDLVCHACSPQLLLDGALREKGEALAGRALREENEVLRHDVLRWRAAAQAARDRG